MNITNRFTGAVIYTRDVADATIKETVEHAVKNGAKIEDEREIVDSRAVLQIGPLGSRDDTLLVIFTTQGGVIKAGCFTGGFATFETCVNDQHGDNKFGNEYRAAIAFARAYADLQGYTV